MHRNILKNLDSLIIANPTGLDKAIATLQCALGCLSWLDKVFGRAWERKIAQRLNTTRTAADVYNSETRTRIAREPFAYAGNGEYISMLPNDTLKAYCFFVANGEERFETKERKSAPYLTKRNVSVIVWANLKELGYQHIATESLKGEVLKLLQKESCIESIDSAVDERSELVFDGFDLDEVKQELLAYPFAGFRINFTVKYSQEC
mgnify:CR=1 FL=1